MSQDPRIEAAARAIYADVNKGHSNDKGWDEVRSQWQASYRSNARAALAAADKAATITEANPRDILDALTDPDDCLFDHNNSCQVHGHYYLSIGEQCPNQAAKDWVAAYDERGTE